jgi:NAD(P)-dependent dehydrogenase (short-subunit alcohol dehydrogenase family)
MKLVSRVALVTGGGRGIGRGIARGLAEAGADVAIGYANRADAAEATKQELQELGRRALAVQADITDPGQVQAMVSRVIADLGQIDILVNNAGTHRRAPFLEIPLDLWRRVIDVDLTGPFLVGQTVARHMASRGYGKIINLTSINAAIAQHNLAHYAAAKGGLFMLTRGMALDLAKHGIRVNAIAPGLVRTDLTQPVMEDADVLASRVARMPLGGPLEPKDLAGAAVFLASSESDMITGATITVDAGTTVW